MKCSVFSICSEALDMLEFSTKMARENAGMDFDYILILWNPSDEVRTWAINQPNIHIFYYETDKDLSFIENLRSAINFGFRKSFEFNEYSAFINVDMAFNKGWLFHLFRYADENRIVNCRQIEKNYTPYHESMHDFGLPIEGQFKLKEWYDFCSSIWEDRLLSEQEWGRRVDATPNLLHRSIFEKLNGWNVTSDRFINGLPSDMDFFNRAKQMGIENTKSLGSIVFHAGGGGLETKRIRAKYGNNIIEPSKDNDKNV